MSHRDILDSVGAGIYAADLQGRFLYFNERALKTLGYTVADGKRLLGTSFFDILPPGQNADAADRMRSGAQRPLDDHHFRLDVRRKDATTVTLDILATPLWHKSAVAGRVGIARVVDPKEASSSDPADHVERAVRKERERIARALKSHIVDVVYGAGAVDNGAPAAIVGDVPPSPGDVLRRHALDDTDLAILRLVIKGASNPEIGRQVHLSAAAVKDRIGRLMRRLGAHRRAELPRRRCAPASPDSSGDDAHRSHASRGIDASSGASTAKRWRVRGSIKGVVTVVGLRPGIEQPQRSRVRHRQVAVAVAPAEHVAHRRRVTSADRREQAMLDVIPELEVQALDPAGARWHALERWPGPGGQRACPAWKPELTLGFHETHQWIAYATGHLDLLSRAEVYETIRSWLSA